LQYNMSCNYEIGAVLHGSHYVNSLDFHEGGEYLAMVIHSIVLFNF
jgi:hypothetical protein